MKPTASPYPFPILWHRTMAQVMADESREQNAPDGLPLNHDSARKIADRESVCTARPGPDQSAEVERPAMPPFNARGGRPQHESGSAQ